MTTHSNAHGIEAVLETALRDAWIGAGHQPGTLSFRNAPHTPPDAAAALAGPLGVGAAVWARATLLGGDGQPLTAGRRGVDPVHDEGTLTLFLQAFQPALTGTGAMRRALDPLRAALRRRQFVAPDGTEATVVALSLPRYADPETQGPAAGWASLTVTAALSVIEPV